jgi:hypothetical protein
MDNTTFIFSSVFTILVAIYLAWRIDIYRKRIEQIELKLKQEKTNG